MLFIKKKKRKTFAVPAISRQAVEEVVEKAVAENAPGKAVARIKKIKTYIQARLDGSSKKEASALANYSGPEKQLLQNPVGQSILESLLAQTFSDEKIHERLKEMWDEADVIKDKNGRVVYEKKNHKVREFAFEKVLELRKLKSKDDDKGGDRVPTTIVFNVQQIPEMPKSAVDGAVEVQAEEVK